MRPNTPHIVYTAESAVCLGGHYYSASTLRDTCYGMIHSFVAGSVVTNTSHVKEAFMLLARMVIFYHDMFLLETSDSDKSDDSEEDEVVVQRQRTSLHLCCTHS